MSRHLMSAPRMLPVLLALLGAVSPSTLLAAEAGDLAEPATAVRQLEIAEPNPSSDVTEESSGLRSRSNVLERHMPHCGCPLCDDTEEFAKALDRLFDFVPFTGRLDRVPPWAHQHRPLIPYSPEVPDLQFERIPDSLIGRPSVSAAWTSGSKSSFRRNGSRAKLQQTVRGLTVTVEAQVVDRIPRTTGIVVENGEKKLRFERASAVPADYRDEVDEVARELRRLTKAQP